MTEEERDREADVEGPSEKQTKEEGDRQSERQREREGERQSRQLDSLKCVPHVCCNMERISAPPCLRSS